jgi:guanylate kinase
MVMLPQPPGLLYFLVAPAGAGKNALMKIVMERIPTLQQLPTATTRGIRPGEEQGREHLFVSMDEFQHMIEHSELLEWQEVHGRFYGVPRETVESAIREGRDLIADIDYKGATYIRSLYPENIILIFIQPPSVEVLIERMRARGEHEAEIARRLVRVPREMAAAAQCDYLIVNEELEQAANTLYSIIVAEDSYRAARAMHSPDGKLATYLCVIAGVLVYGDEILTRIDGSPLVTSDVEAEELPFEAVIRALQEQVGLTVTKDQLPSIVTQDGKKLIVPTAIDSGERDGQKEVTVVYVARLQERITPPDGWAWKPQDQVALPRRVLDTLAASPL